MLLIKNANIVTADDIFPGDILIEGETISRIDSSISYEGAEVIDASGQYVLPGGVDVHTHFDLKTPMAKVSDDFFTGTVAAAHGGTTTVVDHPSFGPSGCRLNHQIEVYHKLAENSVVDYGFHGVIQHIDEQVFDDMPKLLKKGISSYKVYLTYNFKLNDYEIIQTLSRAKELGLIICAHCENDAGIAFLTSRLISSGLGTPNHFPASRPPAAEAESVERLLRLAEMAGDAPLYIVHLSCEQSLDAVRRAKDRGQKNVFVETCPQYLWLDESKYNDDPQGLKYIINPPLRSKADQAALWHGLSGDIDVVATDHCPFFFEQKKAGVGDFSRSPGGAPGVETRLSLMFSEALTNKRLTLSDVVRLCCTRPAEIFGLASKGNLKPGADADLVIFNPDVEKIIEKKNLHENVDYTPYEGLSLKGMPVMTISRGEIIVKNGLFTGRKGRGRYLSRTQCADL